MKRKIIILAAIAIVAVTGWFAFRPPDGGGEKKGMLKERVRAAESAMQTLDAERASGREKLRLAGKKADATRAQYEGAAAALAPYEQRRKEAEINLAEHDKQRRADGPEQPAADDAALLRRLNALLR